MKIPQYHNYDRFPEIAVTTEQTAVSGAAAIAQVLKERITGDCVLVFDCYPGLEARTLSPIFALLAPNAVFDAEECMLDKDTYADKIQPYLTDDRVFGYLCKDNWSDYFDMQKIAAMQERIRNTAGVKIVWGVGAALITTGDILVCLYLESCGASGLSV